MFGDDPDMITILKELDDLTVRAKNHLLAQVTDTTMALATAALEFNVVKDNPVISRRLTDKIFRHQKELRLQLDRFDYYTKISNVAKADKEELLLLPEDEIV
jgi:hypothetical protein